jgi:hypothetical protein
MGRAVPQGRCGIASPAHSQQVGSPILVNFYPERQLLMAVILATEQFGGRDMPVILWLLGVPLSVIVIAALFGVF